MDIDEVISGIVRGVINSAFDQIERVTEKKEARNLALLEEKIRAERDLEHKNSNREIKRKAARALFMIRFP